jgi:NAD(P)H-dependent flavin oxidoreductase YrpB (nitropropane dioxygenase family)
MQFEIIAATPPGFAGVGVVRAAHAAGFSGALGLADCGGEQRQALLAALAASQTEFTVSIGALTKELCALLKASAGCARVILAAPGPSALERDIRSLKNAGLRVLVEVTSLADALAARDAGADGLIAKGNESGGAVGEETTLVLLQHLLGARSASEAAPCGSLPVFARGAVGLRTAAACLAAGAAGVVLDWQLALCEESDVPEAVKARVAKMDGSETAILGEDAGARYRVYARPGETAWLELREIADRTGAPDDPAARRRWRQQVEARAAAGELLLIGQDAALARPLADEFRTVAAVCRAIRGEALRLCRVAHRLNVLRAGGPLAEAHGTRYPIVQGPMTRVSDRASFAVAVSQGGALPFLALALMRAREVDALLQETKQAMAGSPWGVGILGFVPKELRDEQLAVVRKHRPPFAVIAGGRPDQAKSLEDDGIRTYLHVPSPGLLESFLESGARRFIFEGRECGGHVGPRTSFVLWELMIAVILKHLKESASASRADEYAVLFAGGIHDSLSAAMVSALAAPLAERGVRIGVLLGTGYLFTHEAVTSGAIEPGFQQEVIACRDTLLLETGVGHSTRCANTPFGRYFAEEKRKLAREGRSREEIREALERLNLGRLHLASKGMRREETPDGRSSYAHVDDPEQRREGL